MNKKQCPACGSKRYKKNLLSQEFRCLKCGYIHKDKGNYTIETFK